MKFLHISDIHLGRKQIGGIGDYSAKRYNDFFDAFNYMVEFAINENLDAIIIAGDLFDKKEINPDVLSKTIDILNKAKIENLPIICIEGNHDNIQSNNIQDSWIIYLEEQELIKRPFYEFIDNVYKFEPIVINDVYFYGIGYNGAFTDDVITKFAEIIPDETKNVLITHTAIAGDNLFHGTVRSETISQLKDKCIYVAGGHFHNFSAYPSEKPFFFVPGSLEYWDNGEFSQKKGGVIFDTDSLEFSYIQSKNRKVQVIKLINDFDKIEEFYNYFNNEINQYQFDIEQIVSLEIKNISQTFPDTSYLEEFINQKGALRVFINFTSISNRNYNQLSGKNILIEEIEQEIMENWEQFSTNIRQSVDTLKLLKEYQTESTTESADNFKNVFDSWISSIIQEQQNEN